MDSKDKIAVLMSAYNGEKYISQQIDSVLTQTYSKVDIYVRDDGSTDQTCRILEKYESEGKLHLLKGQNKGFARSFFLLLRKAPEAEYYAWCDQDDVWRSEKLERAIEKIQKTERNSSGIPVLYFSDYDFYDEKLTYIGRGIDYKKGPSFANALMDCIPLGITCVFNRKAYEMMMEHTPKYSCGQDWWVYLLCAGLGKVIYDKGYSSVKYRRLKSSVSPAGWGFWKFQWYRIRKFFFQGYFRNVRRQLQEFSDYYREKLEPGDRQLLDLLTGRRPSLIRSVRKAFYPVRFRQNMIDEILLRILFLFGIL